MHTCSVANQIAMFMALSRAFDTSSNSSRFRELKTLLKAEGYKELANVVDKALYPHQSLVVKILDIRSQLIAHTESNQTDEAVLKRNGVKPEEIKNLIDVAKRVLVRVSTTLRVYNRCFITGFHNQSTLDVLAKLKS
ncbi:MULTISPECIES: AbiU2 domain-containing protein [unclassified Agarivorans]|uniref:AbiU2 domain-containing protein n=1 Tax=unclassified Agarivorans TaxID=2636026 RepID=UPI0026E3E401|nr:MULTISPECIES: hypothetical protein [unclassified Agarivorans]MDO6687024.1 hypothetical protein [Agarivorans sp. 3_MG-2023]MDO6713564.1 hypothetical protein [Agarivorans sp. 2_MG-2023]